MNGVMYYELYPGSSTNPVGWIAVDLRTGQTLWTHDSTETLRCGQLLQMVTPNQYGSIAYLWSTGNPLGASLSSTTILTGLSYNMYDAMTGDYVLTIANGTSMSLTEDESGNLIGYYVNSSTANAYHKPTLNMWNSTQAIFYPTSQYVPGDTTASWSWRPRQDSVIDFQRGVVWSYH